MRARGIDNPTPQDRFATLSESARIAYVRNSGTVPPDCGPEIPAAPARGPVRQFQPVGLYPDGEDGFVLKPAGFAGRKALVCADIFDIMAAQARRRKSDPPFSRAQIAIAREYRTLVERHDSAGVRCSSVEGLPGGSGGGTGGFIDAVVADGRRIALLRRRVGTGSAMVVRRMRPSRRGTRRNIPDLYLVDALCLRDETLGRVLGDFGWAAKKSANIMALRQALAAALDRMSGPVRGRGIQSVHFDMQ
ncbi:MAG TPA: hypothetical protein ENK28_04950 [Aliiroseovarius sp.]|nr:hypothetical protein [Aliiroseovarius sp.]